MNEETNEFQKGSEQFAAFQKIWSETFTRLMQAGFTASPEAPPEFLRQIRTGIFEALSRSWDEFLRSPQFLESMKQWMDGALAFRKATTDFLTRAHHETQTPAREDIDSILLAVRQVEQRLLDRMDALESRLPQPRNMEPPTLSRRTKGTGRRRGGRKNRLPRRTTKRSKPGNKTRS